MLPRVALCLLGALASGAVVLGEPAVPPGARPGDCATNQIIVRLHKPAHDKAERMRKPHVRRSDFDALPHLGARVQTEARRWRVNRIRSLYPEEFARPDLAARFGLDRTYVVEVPAGTDTRTLAQVFAGLSEDVESATVDAVGGVAETIPDDPYFSYQWGLRNTGQAIGICSGGVNSGNPCHVNANCTLCSGGSNHGNPCTSSSDCPRACSGGDNHGDPCMSSADCPGGTCPTTTCPSGSCVGAVAGFADKDIDASDAWDIDDGVGEDVVVAVIDSGVYNHPEFAGRLLTGRNTYGGPLTYTTDECGHGTHVAGIIAAAANNGVGVTGVNWGAKILPVRILGSAGLGFCGPGTETSLANGIIWAADQGADVANLSLQYYFRLTCSGGTRPNQACEGPEDCPGGGTCLDFTLVSMIQDAVDYASYSGTLIVAATGNLPNGNPYGAAEDSIGFPARSRRSVAVGGSTATDTRARLNPNGWASKYGPQIDVMAPGDRIYSTYVFYNPLNVSYARSNGTSMATPHVAGLASLLKAYSPTLTRDDLMDLLILSADDLGPTDWDVEYGYGRINAHTALMAASAWPTVTNSEPANYGIDAGQPGDPFGFEVHGWQTFRMDLPPEEVAKVSTESFRVLQKGGLSEGIPQVQSVSVVDEDTVEVILDVPVQSLTWTTLRYERLGAITLGALPGDVNGNQVTNEDDLTALVESMDAEARPPFPPWSGDINRSGLVTPLDILRCADLLNGADAYDEYMQATLP